MDMSFQKILAQNLEVSTVPLTQTHKTVVSKEHYSICTKTSAQDLHTDLLDNFKCLSPHKEVPKRLEERKWVSKHRRGSLLSESKSLEPSSPVLKCTFRCQILLQC